MPSSKLSLFTPALLISTSMCGTLPLSCAAQSAMPCSLDTSSDDVSSLSPYCWASSARPADEAGSRAVATTVLPCCSSCLAHSRPMPRDAPVITQILSAIFMFTAQILQQTLGQVLRKFLERDPN
ncbi:hypothetical protein COO60DRAFT_1561925 [Scenedesmus sp. NREL 46B-D3]|nr:hypothetical protein COO60DRAFT_1561925 [Scenedesmus sp. NREL 46B-D3]